ncbi:MAG: oxalate:formate antiporter [Actinobacteria bacterium HGW-Actinobacteria-1]|jgi:OFA family oxalate/formate antiporter-like MFS transporter|nr:MAG: oxalate:formate antiporter [Actinobacteria bacterium HGW-Actinobacteria-1]
MTHRASARGWIVTLAGLGINLALGVLYSWSIIAKALTAEWGWSAGQSSLPYATAVGTFALSMVFAGRAQDKFGPRIVATVGGVLTGLGLLVASFASASVAWPMIVGFGVLAGAGIGLGYASATPAAVKWFPPARKGFVTGLVVSGFGLASVYIAPLTTALIHGSGIAVTLRILGGSFFVAIIGLAQMLVNPPAGFVPQAKVAAVAAAAVAEAKPMRAELDWRDMLKTKQFALLWLMYAFSAFAGLMIIGHMAKIAAAQLPGIDLGFGLVAVLAIGNAAGRVAAGTAADRFGETRTMFVVFVLQACMMGAIFFARTPLSLIPVAAAVGFCYGSNLSLFPSATAGFFGTRHLGVNYGLVFTAWGVGGVFGSMTAGTIVDSTGSYAVAYGVAAVLCLLAAATTFVTKAPEPIAAPVTLKTKSRRHRAA